MVEQQRNLVGDQSYAVMVEALSKGLPKTSGRALQKETKRTEPEKCGEPPGSDMQLLSAHRILSQGAHSRAHVLFEQLLSSK